MNAVVRKAVEYVRVPPHSIEAERAVLGALLLDNRVLAEIANFLRADDFYRRDHRLIFGSILACDAAGKPYDAVTLADFLEARKELDAAGGLAYLAEMARDTPTPENAAAYARVVHARAVRRALIRTGADLIDLGYHGGDDVEDDLDAAQAMVLAISDSASASDAKPIVEAFSGWLDETQRRTESGDGLLGVATGFHDLDELTCGMEAGDLWVLGARPSVGKSALALNIAEHLTLKLDKPVLYFSLEMSMRQLLVRSLSNLARVPHDALRHVRLDTEQWNRITAAGARLNQARLFVDDTPAQSTVQMRAAARRVKQRHGLALIVVDHMHLVAAKAENRTQELTQISRDLKALAKALNVPVLALAQLNRGVETRAEKRPTLADLRECGAIEQDADVITFLYREGRYNKGFTCPGVAELNIDKQRSGPTGQVLLAFNSEYSRFNDLAPAGATEYRAALKDNHTTKTYHGGFGE